MSGPDATRFAFRPGVVLELEGRPSLLAHYRAEYRPAVADRVEPPNVRITFAEARRPVGHRYKTVWWRVALGDPAADPMAATVQVGGRPLSFALSMLQGYVIEPLLAVAATRADLVLLPAAAIDAGTGATLLLGRSRSGKTSLAARALASGRRVLGDDHVFCDRRGYCYAFPRRLRVYTDLAETAPDALPLLSRRMRLGLRARKLARLLTRGYVAPPLRVPPEALGSSAPLDGLPLRRVVAIERDETTADVHEHELDIDATLAIALSIIDAQRATLRAVDPRWDAAHTRARGIEREVLAAALRNLSLYRVAVPDTWPARLAVSRLADVLGL